MGGFKEISSMLITSCCCIIIILSVVKLAIATGHAMQVFNDLHYSNRCRFISIACVWPVTMAILPLNTVQCLCKNTKSGFVPIIVLIPPAKPYHRTTEQMHVLMGRQYLFVDISNCEHYRKM